MIESSANEGAFSDAKCLHYYFYFIDEELRLCYVRVPTWCPFRLQIYLNGHNRLANRWRRFPAHGNLKVVTTRLRPGYLQLNGVPYSENAVVTEYFHVTTRNPTGTNGFW